MTEKRDSSKRMSYINWDEYFMGVAFLSAKRSKDPNTQVGACIVNNDNRIVGTGYNGMPTGCSDDEFPWTKSDDKNSKHLYVCHAEMNAILNKYSSDLKGCKIYVSLFPCNECAKMIIQSGIKKVIYVSDKHKDRVENEAAKKMFKSAKVEHEPLTPRNPENPRNPITIDFWEDTKMN